MRTKSPKDNIPILDNLYEVTKEFVKEHQGEKGYIDTSNEDICNDNILAICFSFVSDCVVEKLVTKIRVNAENDDLEIMVEYSNDWKSVRWGDEVYFIHTIFSIAESIEQYVEE